MSTKPEVTAIAVVDERPRSPLSVVDITKGNLPSLKDSEEIHIDLMSDYYTPTNPGEKKRVFFDCIDNRPVIDQQSGEIIDLECAFFLEQTENGVRRISNGSKRLVGALQAASVPRGTALQITYMGKKKNRNNAHMSDNWSIKPLVVNVTAQ